MCSSDMRGDRQGKDDGVKSLSGTSDWKGYGVG